MHVDRRLVPAYTDDETSLKGAWFGSRYPFLHAQHVDLELEYLAVYGRAYGYVSW